MTACFQSGRSLRLLRQVIAALLIFSYGTLHATDVPALVRATKPAVVELLCYDRNGELNKTGSGFFISPDGKLLTNCHMLEGDSFSIIAQTTSGKRYSKMRILSAPVEKNYSIERDVAELQFDDAKDVPYLSLGSSKNAAEGQRVLVIGNPEGLTGTVSDGIIAAFRKNGSVIQITAPISPGSSGSPVIDETGNVLGMAAAIREEGQNLNFAISADAARIAISKNLPANQEKESLIQEAIHRGEKKIKEKDFVGARKLFTACVLVDPDNQYAYAGRGLANAGLREFDHAISDFTEAIRISPNYALAYLFRAKVYDLLKDHASAEEDRKKAKELTAGSSDPE
jgi:tetratricopeptide (TPR) repeat protein